MSIVGVLRIAAALWARRRRAAIIDAPARKERDGRSLECTEGLNHAIKQKVRAGQVNECDPSAR